MQISIFWTQEVGFPSKINNYRILCPKHGIAGIVGGWPEYTTDEQFQLCVVFKIGLYKCDPNLCSFKGSLVFYSVLWFQEYMKATKGGWAELHFLFRSEYMYSWIDMILASSEKTAQNARRIDVGKRIYLDHAPTCMS